MENSKVMVALNPSEQVFKDLLSTDGIEISVAEIKEQRFHGHETASQIERCARDYSISYFKKGKTNLAVPDAINLLSI